MTPSCVHSSTTRTILHIQDFKDCFRQVWLNWIQCNSNNKKPGSWDGYLADTEVSWSEGWRILQVVKVYVELVWDIHFPGKLTRGEGEENRGCKRWSQSEHCTQECGGKVGHDHSIKAPSNSTSFPIKSCASGDVCNEIMKQILFRQEKGFMMKVNIKIL